MNGASRQLRSRDSKKDETDVSESGSAAGEEDDLATASHYLNLKGVGAKRKEHMVTVQNTPKKRRKLAEGSEAEEGNDLQDVYCWQCHRECVEGALDCSLCPRTFHSGCTNGNEEETPGDDWICPVCLEVRESETGEKIRLSQNLGVEELNSLLSYALKRMKHQDSEPFHHPVPMALVPDYYDLVFHPMDLSTMEKKVKKQMYGSTEAFVEDAKWIVHNSIVFNGATSKYSSDAKLIIKICRHEIGELELCPDCYRLSTLRPEGWFSVPCTKTHCLVWAKLKGFPFWPGKVLRINSQSNVDVRFFGEYDRAWIPLKDCYLLSKEPPQVGRNIKRLGLDKAMEELGEHIRRLKAKFDTFHYAAQRVNFTAKHIENVPMIDGESEDDTGTELNGVFTMDDTLNEELSQAGSRLEANADNSMLPNEESLGILDRLQSSLVKDNDREPSPAVDAPQTSSAKPTPSRKRNLDMLLEKMHEHKSSKTTEDKSKTGVKEIIQKHTDKIAEFVRCSLEEMGQDLGGGRPSSSAEGGTSDCKEHTVEITNLRTELNKLKWSHSATVAELKHANKVALSEMKNSFEAEKQRHVGDLMKKFEIDKQKAVALAKTKQWCANCAKEAVFYCCWNTSYCDYPCQQAHWPKHQFNCAQIRASGTNTNTSNTPSDSNNQNSKVLYQLPTQGQVVPVYATGLPPQGYIAVTAKTTASQGIALIPAKKS